MRAVPGTRSDGARPVAAAEIRLVALRTLRGANFWSTRPVTRLDVAVGAYDEISSADVSGFTENLIAAMPGLVEHRCSVGERGGFVTRLRRGTYAPHVLEHVALELQDMAGHEVGFGRARGGDRRGEYTVVMEHLHAEVGLRAAALALDLVRDAFAGERVETCNAVAELRALAATPAPPPPERRVVCGVGGGGARAAVRDELLRLGLAPPGEVVEISPAYLLNAGLPYARSEIAILLDARAPDVPERYRDPEQARRLVSVMADGVPSGGFVLVPEAERELQQMVRDAGRRVAVFADPAEVADLAGRVLRSHRENGVGDGEQV
jgi:hypothetical protein